MGNKGFIENHKGRRTFGKDYLLVGKKSMVLTLGEKTRMFPRAIHMPLNKRTISRVCVFNIEGQNDSDA